MRISDWSSDVCSSDLRKRITHRQARAPLISPQLVRAEARGELAKMPERLRLGHLREIGQIEHVDHESARRVELLSTGGELREIAPERSEEHTSELQSLMRISYAVFCLKKKTTTYINT